MEEDVETSIGELLSLMSEYSKLKPGLIEKACKEQSLNTRYFRYTTLLVESFFTVYSFCLLSAEALHSNASATLRTLIEQVSIAYVLTNNSKALELYLDIYDTEIKYRSKNVSIEDINKKYGRTIKDEDELERFFDYGFSLSFGGDGWSKNKILKESEFEKLNPSIKIFNKFVHGQFSWYTILRYYSKEELDRFLVRNAVICGEVFQYLCYATYNFLGEIVEDDYSYELFCQAKQKTESLIVVLQSK